MTHLPLSPETETLRTALQNLVNEVGGMWRAFEDLIRPAISNTNFACVQRRLDDAKEVLAQTAPFYGAQCPSYPACDGGCGLGCTHEIEQQRGLAQTPAVPASIEEIAQMIGIEFRNDPWAARRAAERVYNFLDARISVRAKTLARQATTSGLPHCEGQAVECDGGLHTVSDTSTGRQSGPTSGFRLIEEPCEHHHCEFPSCGCEVPISSPVRPDTRPLREGKS